MFGIDEILAFFREPYKAGEEGYGWDSAVPRSDVEALPLKLKELVQEKKESIPRRLAERRINNILEATAKGRKEWLAEGGGPTEKIVKRLDPSASEIGPAGQPVEYAPPEPDINIDGLISYGGEGIELAEDSPLRKIAKVIGPQAFSKLEKIRAEARMKGRGGSLKSAPGAEPTLEDYQAAKNSTRGFEGSISQAADSPELRQREAELALYAASATARAAAQELMYPESRGKMSPETVAQMRETAQMQADEARNLAGLRLLDAAKDESGLVSPTAAFNYQQFTGEKLPPEMVGTDFPGAQAELFNMRSEVEKLAAYMNQANMGMSTAGTEFSIEANKVLQTASRELQSGMNPNIVIARAKAALASIEPSQVDPAMRASMMRQMMGDQATIER